MKDKGFLTAIIIMILTAVSCSNQDECQLLTANSNFEFKKGARFCVSEDLEFEISDILDQRCPCDVACVWEGEFVFLLRIYSGPTDYYYLWHESIETTAHPETGIAFEDIDRAFDDSCEAMVQIDDMRFTARLVIE